MDHLRIRAFSLIQILGEVGSLHQAARRLNTSQPALSVMLRELERALGGRLFTRSRRGLVATELGNYAISHANLILSDLKRLQREAAAASNGGSLLRVGSLPVLMLEIVPKTLALLRQSFPTLQVEFREGSAPDLLTELAVGHLDIVVGRMLPEFVPNDDLASTALFAETFCVIGRADHPFTRRRGLTWRQLQAADWVETPVTTILRNVFSEAFLRRGLKPPQPKYESASFYSSVAILRTSDCLMMVPNQVSEHFTNTGVVRALPVRVGEATASYSLLRRRSRAETPGGIAFEKALLQIITGRPRSVAENPSRKSSKQAR